MMDALAAVAERVAAQAGRLRKISLVADYLRGLSEEDLARAVRFFGGSPFAGSDPRRLSIGYVMVRDAAVAVSGWDAETVRVCLHDVGDLGETIGLLLAGRTQEAPLSLAQAEAIYAKLHAARRQAGKFDILRTTLERYRPLALKYFVKVIAGELRIGLQQKMVEEAVALATGAPAEAVREAANRSGDLARVALAARAGTLETVEARLFHAMDFMLAKPVESLDEIERPSDWIIEDKYDGIRAQAHIAEGRAVIFTRGLAEVTAAFPELEGALRAVPGSALLDGEILAWQNGRAMPFTILQQRLARKIVPLFMPLEVPVVFMAYDLLYRDGELLLDRPIEERRALLEAALAGHASPLIVSPQTEAHSVEEIAALFEAARARGNEGLVLKRRGSVYESGRRSGEWVKWKQPYATLDVVVTAAEQGHGKRASVLSDYTFAVRSGDEFLNVGKAYSGLTDNEIRELTRIFRSIEVGRFGPVLVVRPEVVLEVAFNGIQKSARHKSGYALRFPRIVRWRRDKRAEDADPLERVAALYQASLQGA
ncbi:MAG TPA: cisplatin damage response ATP-dependent DNA ligase [Bryobacteraceae bacterium]